MKYDNLKEGKFLRRINRFTCEVEVENKVFLTHIPTTAKLPELLQKDRICYLKFNDDKNRKTSSTLVSVKRGEEIFYVDSYIANELIFDAINDKKILKDIEISNLKREVKYKDQRFDMAFENEREKGFIEVKSVTLRRNNIAMFPGAPTERGRKHLKGLIDAKRNGHRAILILLLLFEKVDFFTPNIIKDEKWSELFDYARENGVEIFVFNSKAKNDSIEVDREVEIKSGFKIENADLKYKEEVENMFLESSLMLKEMGVNQWQNDELPNYENMKNSIKDLRVLIKEDEGVGTFSLNKIDSDYKKSEELFKIDGSYEVVHKFQVKNKFLRSKFASIMEAFIEEILSTNEIDIIRMDTHKDNFKMRNFLKKIGFIEGSTIVLGGDLRRILYEKFVDKSF